MVSDSNRLARVLLVDDNPFEIKLFSVSLLHLKIELELHTTQDGRDAVESLNERRLFDGNIPDLVLLDLNMPIMNGLQVLEELKKRPETRDIPVVMFSGSDRLEDINAAEQRGALDYMVKPIDIDKLKKVVANVDTIALQENADAVSLMVQQ
jgi:CheY-like chemotaxis protein